MEEMMHILYVMYVKIIKRGDGGFHHHQVLRSEMFKWWMSS